MCLTSSPEHPTYRMLPFWENRSLHVSGNHPSSAYAMPSVEFFGKLFAERMVRLDIYSKGVRNGLTPRNAYAKQQSISKVANGVGKVKESSPCRKKFAKYRRYCTYRLRNVKDVKDRDGVLNSSGGTRKKIDYIFTNSFFFCSKYFMKEKKN